MAVNKEKDKIVVREMATNGLTHWNLKQATTKYNNILKEFRVGSFVGFFQILPFEDIDFYVLCKREH